MSSKAPAKCANESNQQSAIGNQLLVWFCFAGCWLLAAGCYWWLMMRLGIFGGTFNPIHLGHLILAEFAREQCRLDQVWFIPTASPPHKAARDLADGRHRLAMVRLAVQRHPHFRTVDMELTRGGRSYTVETVREVQRHYPNARLYYLVGSDMLRVPWVGLDELRRRGRFVVAGRPLSDRRARRHATRSANPHFGQIQPVAMPELAISSSMIRERIAHGRSIHYLVPDAVERYLRRHRLYRRGETR